MIRFNNREDIIALTPLWKGERFPDGRPRVADKYLEEMRKMTLEELWKPIFLKGYESQFEGDLKTLHDDGRKLIGRAVTATFVPTRPDLHEVMFGVGATEGRKGNYNQWVIDSLTEGDVVVVDMYDKIYKGTFLGGNLTTAIKTRTKTGSVAMLERAVYNWIFGIDLQFDGICIAPCVPASLTDASVVYRMQKKELSLRFHGYGNAVVKANVGRVSDGKLFVNEGEIAGKNIHVYLNAGFKNKTDRK